MSTEAAELGRVADALVATFGGDAHLEQIRQARQEYADARGRVFEDEDLWESWTQAFLEWYVVERAWPPGSAPIAELEARRCSSDVERAALSAWARSQRSLVEILELRQSEVEVRDLVGGATFSVVEDRNLYGVSRGDVVEVRLLGFAGRVHFGRTFVYHPSGTLHAIGRRVGELLAKGATRGDTIDAIAALRIRCERYRHVSAVRIYESDEHLPAAEAAGQTA